MDRIVVTGMGAVTPVGTGVKKYWDNLIDGKCGIGLISRFDTAEQPVRIAGEVTDIDVAQLLPKKFINETDLFMQYAYIAAEEALAMSGAEIVPERTGIVMGTALGGVSAIAKTQEELTAMGRKVGPRFLPKILGNIAAAQLSIAKGITGPSFTVSTACSSGGDAIIMSAMLLRSGEADMMIALGADAGICPIVMQSLHRAMALSKRNDDPESASRPFDINRDGFVMGEGAGALILETEEHAKKRGAKIYAELLGYANNTDGYHVTAPQPEGHGAAACMRIALKKAGIDRVDYINAHGTSTHAGDRAETLAIKSVFKNPPPVSSTKGATGHLMGGGGITEVIACINAIDCGVIPPTLNLEEPDPECDLDYVSGTARQAAVETAMSNAFGFGGQNSSIIVGRYK